MSRVRNIALLLATAVALCACQAPADTRPKIKTGLEGSFDLDTLVIVSDDGVRTEFDVYLAIEPQQQRRGLMFVRSLPQRTGMLFVYDDAAIHSMWMKNTYIPLDMVFARSDGAVSSVIHDTVPLSLTSQSAIEPVNFILELSAGTARRYDIGTASRIIWSPKQTRD